MKKLFFIALFAIGFVATSKAQCVTDNNYSNPSAPYMVNEIINFNGKLYRTEIEPITGCVTVFTNNATIRGYVNNNDYYYDEYDSSGFSDQFYSGVVKVDGYRYNINASTDFTGDVLDYSVCKR